MATPRQPSTSARSFAELEASQKDIQKRVLALTKELKSTQQVLETVRKQGVIEEQSVVSSHGSATLSGDATESDQDYPQFS